MSIQQRLQMLLHRKQKHMFMRIHKTYEHASRSVYTGTYTCTCTEHIHFTLYIVSVAMLAQGGAAAPLRASFTSLFGSNPRGIRLGARPNGPPRRRPRGSAGAGATPLGCLGGVWQEEEGGLGVGGCALVRLRTLSSSCPATARVGQAPRLARLQELHHWTKTVMATRGWQTYATRQSTCSKRYRRPPLTQLPSRPPQMTKSSRQSRQQRRSYLFPRGYKLSGWICTLSTAPTSNASLVSCGSTSA